MKGHEAWGAGNALALISKEWYAYAYASLYW